MFNRSTSFMLYLNHFICRCGDGRVNKINTPLSSQLFGWRMNLGRRSGPFLNAGLQRDMLFQAPAFRYCRYSVSPHTKALPMSALHTLYCTQTAPPSCSGAPRPPPAEANHHSLLSSLSHCEVHGSSPRQWKVYPRV